VKILLVHNSYKEPGGEDVAFRQERQLLRAAGHTVYEYHRSNNEIEQLNVLQRLTLPGRAVWSMQDYRAFRKMLRRVKPDLVHVHNTFVLISPSIYAACYSEDVPVVQTLHNYRLFCPGSSFVRDNKPCEECLQHGLLRAVRHACYRQSRMATLTVAVMLGVHRARGTWTRMVDCYIALSAFARNKFVQAGLPADKVRVKPNFVDVDPGMRVSDGSYALYVGRLSREKGIHTVLAAWRRLSMPLPLRIIGDGPFRSELQSEISKLECSDVSYDGQLPHDKVIEAMKGARFLIFPSELYENFPFTLIEAFACGLPVVSSRLGAMQEIVKEKRTGMFFKPGDADDLARVIIKAWQLPDSACRALGRQARAEYEIKYNSSTNYGMLLDIYSQVLAKRRSVPSHVVTSPEEVLSA